MKRIALITCIFIAACGKKMPEGLSYVDTLKYEAENREDPVEKIKAISRLAWYTMEIRQRTSDSVMQTAYAYAENHKGNNNELLVLCYLFDAERHLLLYDYKSHLNAVAQLAEKAANLSVAYGFPDYEAYSYLYKAQANRFLGNAATAKEYISKADALVKNTKSDSLRIEFYTTSSQVYQSNRLLNDALQNASYALTEAEKSDNPNLAILAYRRLGHVYDDIDTLKAKENYKNLLEKCEQQKDKEEMIWANIYLGSYFSSQPEYAFEASRHFHAAQDLAKQISHTPLLMQTHSDLVDFFIKTSQVDSVKKYLDKNISAISDYYNGNGLGARICYTYGLFYFRLGEYYKKSKNTYDADQSFRSAVGYFRKSEQIFGDDVTDSRKCLLQYYYGACSYYLYFLNKPQDDKSDWILSTEELEARTKVSANYRYALSFFFDAQSLAYKIKDPESIRNITSWMEYLFRDSAEYYDKVRFGEITTSRIPNYNYYKMSFLTRQIYDSCDRVFESFKSDKKNFVIEARRNESRAEIAKQKQEKKDNIKIVGIIFALVVVFLLLVLGGYLRASMTVTRGLNFFAFIFLFEFIILLTEKWVHELTHGELVTSLLIKIAIAAILVPLHHYLEEKVIHQIRSRTLARQI